MDSPRKQLSRALARSIREQVEREQIDLDDPTAWERHMLYVLENTNEPQDGRNWNDVIDLARDWLRARAMVEITPGNYQPLAGEQDRIDMYRRRMYLPETALRHAIRRRRQALDARPDAALIAARSNAAMQMQGLILGANRRRRFQRQGVTEGQRYDGTYGRLGFGIIRSGTGNVPLIREGVDARRQAEEEARRQAAIIRSPFVMGINLLPK